MFGGYGGWRHFCTAGVGRRASFFTRSHCKPGARLEAFTIRFQSGLQKVLPGLHKSGGLCANLDRVLSSQRIKGEEFLIGVAPDGYSLIDDALHSRRGGRRHFIPGELWVGPLKFSQRMRAPVLNPKCGPII